MECVVGEKEKQNILMCYFNTTSSVYEASRYDATWDFCDGPVPAFVTSLKETPCDGVMRLGLVPQHLDLLFDKYPNLKLYAQMYYLSYGKKPVIGIYQLTVEIEEFLLSRLSHVLFDCINVDQHGVSGDLDDDHDLPNVNADAHIYTFPDVKQESIVFADQFEMEPPRILVGKAYDGTDLTCVLTDGVYFPENVAVLETRSLDSVEIKRLRKRVNIMGFNDVFKGVHWRQALDMLANCDNDVPLMALKEVVENQIGGYSGIITDIFNIRQYANRPITVLCEGIALDRTRLIRKDFPGLVYLSPNGSLPKIGMSPEFENSVHKYGIDILVLDFSWSAHRDPATALVVNWEFVSSNTIVLVYGPCDVLQLFSFHFKAFHELDGCYAHCLDSMARRLGDLRMFQDLVAGVKCWRWKQQPSLNICIHTHKYLVVVQTFFNYDLYFYGYSHSEIFEFVEHMPIRMGFTHFGVFPVTGWLKIRFYYHDWDFFNKLCIVQMGIGNSKRHNKVLFKDIYHYDFVPSPSSRYIINGPFPKEYEKPPDDENVWECYAPVYEGGVECAESSLAS